MLGTLSQSLSSRECDPRRIQFRQRSVTLANTVPSQRFHIPVSDTDSLRPAFGDDKCAPKTFFITSNDSVPKVIVAHSSMSGFLSFTGSTLSSLANLKLARRTCSSASLFHSAPLLSDANSTAASVSHPRWTPPQRLCRCRRTSWQCYVTMFSAFNKPAATLKKWYHACLPFGRLHALNYTR